MFISSRKKGNDNRRNHDNSSCHRHPAEDINAGNPYILHIVLIYYKDILNDLNPEMTSSSYYLSGNSVVLCRQFRSTVSDESPYSIIDINTDKIRNYRHLRSMIFLGFEGG
jgi:hypothetical protein